MYVVREITRRLAVWDTGACSAVVLEPGAVLTRCRIHRNHEGGEPYVMEFHHAGRLYSCPLFRFQPRTQPVEFVGAESAPAREAVAV